MVNYPVHRTIEGAYSLLSSIRAHSSNVYKNESIFYYLVIQLFYVRVANFNTHYKYITHKTNLNLPHNRRHYTHFQTQLLYIYIWNRCFLIPVSTHVYKMQYVKSVR